MTKRKLQKVKDFAQRNFEKFGATEDLTRVFSIDLTTPCGEEVCCTSVWMDRSGRFELDDKAAIDEWGLAGVVTFIESAAKHLGL